jgi:drug/metabolite transporter (DMT)-like permease
MTSRRGVAVASLVAATAFWAGNYVVGRSAVAELSPVSLVWWRWLLAVGPLLAIAHVLERPQWREVLRHWPWLLGLSAFGLAGYNLLLYSALQFTTAFKASLINAFNPALILLASVVVLHTRLRGRGVVGLLLALLGVLVVLTDGALLSLVDTRYNAGDLVMLAAIASWTAYTVLGRLAPRLPPITSTALQAVVAVLLLSPLAARGLDLPGTGGAVWSLAFIAVFPSVLSYLLWNRALQTIEPAQAGPFLNLITVFTAVLAVAAGEPLTAAQVVGGVFVLLGVVLTGDVSLSRSRRLHSCATRGRGRATG